MTTHEAIPSEEDEGVLVCTACDTSFHLSAMLIAHQTYCDGLDSDKQDYRRSILTLMYGEDNADLVVQMTRNFEANNKKGQ